MSSYCSVCGCKCSGKMMVALGNALKAKAFCPACFHKVINKPASEIKSLQKGL